MLVGPKWIKQVFKNERGTLSVEFVVWMPVFMFVLALFGDAAVLALTQYDMMKLSYEEARDRAFDVYIFEEDDGQTAGANSCGTAKTVNYVDGRFTVDVARTTDSVTVDVSIPYADADAFGIIAPLMSGQMQSSTTLRIQCVALQVD